jgi:hypothetical protein
MIVRVLACALLLIDDFTGKPIQDTGALFYGEGGIANPIRRRDGYYLFLEESGAVPELSVSLPGYLTGRLRAEAEGASRPGRLLTLRMCRASPGGYQDCVWLGGTGPPDTEVLAVAKADESHSFRITAGGREAEQTLSVSGYIARRLTGLCFAAEAPNHELVDFTLEEKLDSGAYRTSGFADWPSEDVIPLRRAYRSLIDKGGKYQIPIDSGAEIQAVYVREGGRWVFCS